MSTTTLFAEILVIGAGTALSALLWVWVVLGGVSMPDAGVDLTSAVLALLPFVYFVGLLIDRVADWLFSPLDAQLGRRIYGASSSAAFQHEYYPDHRLVREESGPLAAVLDYARSRIRICRGWLVNAVLGAAALGYGLVVGTAEVQVAILGLVVAAVVAVACFVIVAVDRREYVKKVRRQAAWLRERS